MTFRLTAHVTVSAWCIVEAKTEAEAIAKASGFPVELNPLGRGVEENTWSIDDADGEPTDIKVDR